jgi:glycosyltransferase involved in cell wall biosynthesis
MNLLHVVPYYWSAIAYGGVVTAVTDLTRAQVEAGHRVTVLTTDALAPGQRTSERVTTIEGVDVIRVRNLSNWLRGRLNLSTPWRMRALAARLISERSIDVVHCHEVRTVENLLVTPVARRLGVPLVVSPHGTLPLDTGRPFVKKTWDRLFAQRLLPRFDRVVALTANEAADVRAIWAQAEVSLREEQIAVVPNGVHADRFDFDFDGPAHWKRWRITGGPIVIFLGRLHERKGVQLLIPAFARAAADVPSAHLVIAGPDAGMRPALEAQIHELDLAGRVVFTGLVFGPDRDLCLRAADIFALPAVGEGFSIAVLEALAASLPVVITPGCNFPEVVDAGAGLVVPRTVEALADALHTLLTDADRRASMGRSARELVLARYHWPAIVAQMDAVYAAVTAR